MIYQDITQLIGNTPMVSISRFSAIHNLQTPLIAKLESFNPLSSVKDRVALAMITEGEQTGKITKDTILIEPTSGNTGIGLAYIAAVKGYKLTLTMPSSMSEERKQLLKALGATLVLTDPSKGMQGAVDEATKLASTTKNSLILSQFDNPANPTAHYNTTAKEILSQTDGKLDFFIAGIGTGGTISGVGKGLKEHNPAIKIIGVEPASSPLLSQNKFGPHKIQGIGANFVPKNLNRAIIDSIVAVQDESAMETSRTLAKSEGILAGVSAGAALAAAVETAKQNPTANIVVLLPDTGERYLSTNLFATE